MNKKNEHEWIRTNSQNFTKNALKWTILWWHAMINDSHKIMFVWNDAIDLSNNWAMHKSVIFSNFVINVQKWRGVNIILQHKNI
jgi:hypothetical protein